MRKILFTVCLLTALRCYAQDCAVQVLGEPGDTTFTTGGEINSAFRLTVLLKDDYFNFLPKIYAAKNESFKEGDIFYIKLTDSTVIELTNKLLTTGTPDFIINASEVRALKTRMICEVKLGSHKIKFTPGEATAIRDYVTCIANKYNAPATIDYYVIGTGGNYTISYYDGVNIVRSTNVSGGKVFTLNSKPGQSLFVTAKNNSTAGTVTVSIIEGKCVINSNEANGGGATATAIYTEP